MRLIDANAIRENIAGFMFVFGTAKKAAAVLRIIDAAPTIDVTAEIKRLQGENDHLRAKLRESQTAAAYHLSESKQGYNF